MPFRTEDGKDLPHWVSRFDIYPYLERYAEVCITLFIPCLSFQKKNIHSLLTGIVYAFISSNSIHSLLGLADKLNAVLQDSCAKILDMLQGKPDLVIGNYTDGNLVASLVSRKLGVTQVMNNGPSYI